MANREKDKYMSKNFKRAILKDSKVQKSQIFFVLVIPTTKRYW